MTKHAYLLSDDDMTVLRGLIRRERDRRVGYHARPAPEPETGTAPETYIARAPSGGITGLTQTPDTFVGTGSGDIDVPTGTGTARMNVVPGFGTCDIYQILTDPNDGVTQELQPCGFSLLVYNLATIPVMPHEWIVITRDKFGSWVITNTLGLQFGVCP